MNENPLPLLMMIALGGYFARMWWSDLRAVAAGSLDAAQALPGARPSTARACVVAAAGGLVVVGAETWGEIALGLSEEQSRITYLFAAYTLVQAFVEELIFRGYVGEWVAKRGRAGRAGAVLGASLLFAALHPFLWTWEGGLVFTFTAKAWFSFTAVFAASLWFYSCRFASWNPNQSLLPCVAAHLAKNAGVVVIKGAQGFLVGWW
jgi:membrane protease YdiL (CAAX protease family)